MIAVRIQALFSLCIAQAKLSKAVRESLSIGDRSFALDMADLRFELGKLRRRAYEAVL